MEREFIQVMSDSVWQLTPSEVVSFDSDELPIDEWQCHECGDSVGYSTYDNSESTGLAWTEVFISLGDDPLSALTHRFCGDCVQGLGVVRDGK